MPDASTNTSIFRSPAHLRVLLVAFGLILIAVQVVMERPGSYDVISYIAAADVFVAGGDPYGADILNAARYDGLPFVYPPGTLWLFAPFAWLPTWLVVVLDGVARLAAFAWAVSALQRRYMPNAMVEHVLFATLLFAPVLNALVAANFVVFSFAAFIGCVVLSERDSLSRREMLAAATCGAALAVKPMWLVAAFIFAARSRWRALAAWSAGVGVVAAASAAQWELTQSWLRRMGELQATFTLADIPTMAPMVYVALVVLWLGWTAWLWVKRRRHPALAVHVCTSVLVWPRVDIHTHLVALWLFAWVWQARGPRVAVAASVGFLLVVPGALRAAGITAIAPDFGWYPEILGYYASTLALSVVLWSTLVASDE